jgi:tRNA dimethylallyltransferase
MTTPPPDCIVVCGPTACGKTRLGVRIAARLRGEILSADSRQVYRGMDIGTGKDLAEYGNDGDPIPCHLIDVAEPIEVYSLWHYQREFYRVFRLLRARGVMPVVVGGSGLYLEAVLKNYPVPNVPEDPGLRDELMRQPRERLLERLGRLDRELLARTDVSSRKRIVRSLEVALFARDNRVEWGHPDPPRIMPLVLAIRMQRAELRRRIRRRLEDRLDPGLVGEGERLSAAGIPRERFDQLGLEYRHVASFLAGEGSHEQMVEELYHSICRFAKRQDTWFRGMERRGIPVTWLDGADCEAAVRVIREAGIG